MQTRKVFPSPEGLLIKLVQPLLGESQDFIESLQSAGWLSTRCEHTGKTSSVLAHSLNRSSQTPRLDGDDFFWRGEELLAPAASRSEPPASVDDVLRPGDIGRLQGEKWHVEACALGGHSHDIHTPSPRPRPGRHTGAPPLQPCTCARFFASP